MRKRLVKEARSSRRSVFYVRNSDHDDDVVGALHAHMLHEDIGYNLVPFPTTGKERFVATLDPQSDELEKSLIVALSNRQRVSLEEAIRDLFSEAIRTALISGRAPYELVRHTDSEDRSLHLDLVHIMPASFHRSFGRCWQSVPRDMAAELKAPTRIRLDPSDIFVFTLPKKYRSRASLALFQLVRMRKYPEMDLMMRGTDSNPKTDFSFERFRENQEIAAAIATKAFGWSGRGMFDKLLEHYWLQRFLDMQAFLADTREHFSEILTGIVERCGQLGHDKAQIRLSGLPTSTDVVQARKRLMSGDGTFKEILDRFA